ncbi:hypothetical protein OG539_32855 [Actinacidiphila glaucinigra]|uniref:hypothetical protein n=1 Tax=Actinacidiphila glaucinigra TaxID=235986 RepID=UPI003244CBF9
MVFDLVGRDRLSRVLRSVGDGADDMGRRIEDSSERSSRAIEGLHRDANGRFRDINGRFVSASAAAESMASSVDRSSSRSRRALDALAPILRGIGVRAHAMADDIDSSGRRSGSALGRLRGMVDGLGSAAMGAVPSLGAMGVALKGVGVAAGITALPAIGALVPMLAGAGLAAGALKLGFSGVGDAMVLAGTDAKKYQEALDKMGPEQRAFTKTLVGLKKEFSGVGREVQKAMLPGFTRLLKSASPLVKQLSGGLTGMGRVLGDTADQFGRLMKDSGFQKEFGQTLKLGTGFIKDITGALAPFTRSLIDFGAASGPTLKAFGDGISGLLGKGLPGMFEGLKGGIQGSADMFTGLFNAVNKVLPALGNFAGAVASAVGPALREIFETTGDNSAMAFDGLAAVIRKLRPVFSEIGAAVRIFGLALQTAGTIAADTGGVIINSLWPSFGKADEAVGPLQRLSTWLKDNKQATQEFARQASNGLIDFFGIVLDNTPRVIQGFRLMTTGVLTALDGVISGAAAAFGWIPGIGPKLKAANKQFDSFKNGWITGLHNAEDATRTWAAEVRPRLEQNKLKMNISNWQSQIESAKAKMKTVPPEKRAALKADIAQLQRQVDAAKRKLAELRNKSVTVSTYYQEFRSKHMGGQAGATGGLYSKAGGFAYAGGGLVHGPGTGTSDDVRAPWLSNGEFVVKESQTRKHLSLLQAINGGRMGFAKGGLVRGLTGKEASTIKADTGHTAVVKLTGSTSAIAAMAKELIGDIQRAFKGTSTKLDDKLVTLIQKNNSKLLSLAKQRDKIAATIKAAKEFASGVTSNARGGAALSGMDAESLTPGGGSILSGLQSKLANIRQFQSYIGILAKRGLNKGLLRQILEMGPEQGLPYASTLVGSSASMLKSINSAQSSIDKASTSLGNAGADVLYDSGKMAGRGFLTGLAAQQKDIEKLMLKIATGMQKSIRKALGIKSPSTVFRKLGQHTTQGLALGLVDRAPAVAGAMDKVNNTVAGAAIGAPQIAAGSGRGGVYINAPITIENAMDPVAVGRELRRVMLELKRNYGVNVNLGVG